VSRESRPLRILIGAFGDPGHAFPAIALGRALHARGHEVAIQTWKKWQSHVEGDGIAFHPAPEYQVFPTRERPLKPYAAVVRAVRETQPLVRELEPHVVVSDILTLAPALAAELERRPWATLVPHVYPPPARGLPPYGIAAMPARTPLGKAFWRLASRPMAVGLERGRAELNETRRRVGLPPLAHVHGGISRELCLVATLPQLEYPRPWPEGVHVTGPLMWEPPAAHVEPPSGTDPLVLVTPSTSQDRRHKLLGAALRGLGGLPVRVLATYNRRPPTRALDVPVNAALVDWLSYSRTMPKADVVVCHGGHGTLVRALVSGVPVVTVPAAGDMAENGVRAQWAGLGLNLPERLLSSRTLRWAVERILADARFEQRAREVARFAAANEGSGRAAALLERFAASRPNPSERPAGALSA